MSKRKELARRLMYRFLFQMLLCLLIALTIYGIGFWYCTRIRAVWTGTEILYPFLIFLKDTALPMICIYLVVCAMVIAYFQFLRVSNGLWEIGKHFKGEAVDNGHIPEELAELNVQLHQYSMEMELSKQAESEANQRKNDLIMYMAHDLKTPLTSMIGYLTLLTEERALPEEIREKYQKIVLDKSLRLEELINEFFEITRFNFSHMILEKQTVNMTRMLRQMVTEFYPIFHERNLTCNMEFEDVEVLCDVSKMERVFDNLLKNIANYSYANSKIGLHLEHFGEKGMRLTTVNKGKTISPEKLDHLFEQFYRVDDSRSSTTGGTGLGLAVSKEIVTLHGGTITCDSADEQIVFTLTLP
ncbi:MAG: HAMP domain-containing histidine kinase [Lachnospiraceae bacterium]|nr:HAMP domain-containing histidine kinase [Lachnospiraceae bacterium]